ncbi:hypothetical protein BB559_005262 [Furculomyces boomerangus]|uniref:SET domain-containing protein n=2 Tax=Harpellales TaxID=61421 RepID=A0A2T9Y9Q8_9FUNG|nr:hypothetical protein BB559_005262 [Furculomyces boomerangus]PVZ98875.1 hypothetical protein BB558_005090 [Smittium angustum]
MIDNNKYEKEETIITRSNKNDFKTSKSKSGKPQNISSNLKSKKYLSVEKNHLSFSDDLDSYEENLTVETFLQNLHSNRIINKPKKSEIRFKKPTPKNNEKLDENFVKTEKSTLNHSLEDLEKTVKLENGLKISNIDGKGRGIVATKNFDVGDTVLVDKSEFYVVDSSCLTSYCSYCLKNKSYVHGSLKRCSSCKMLYYCSKECQKNDWVIHKLECGLTSGGIRKLHTSMRLMARVFSPLYLKEKSSESTLLFEHAFNIIRYQFESHYEKQSEERKVKMAQIAMIIGKDSLNEKVFSGKDAIELFFKVNFNGFTIFDGDQNMVGVGLFCKAFLINHSCSPNCSPVFEGNKMVLKASKRISNGEELTISYVDILLSLETRRDILYENYNFVCNCSSCSNYSSGNLPKSNLQIQNLGEDNTSSELTNSRFSNGIIKCLNFEICKGYLFSSKVYYILIEFEKNMQCKISTTELFKKESNSDIDFTDVQLSKLGLNEQLKNKPQAPNDDTDDLYKQNFEINNSNSLEIQYCDDCINNNKTHTNSKLSSENYKNKKTHWSAFGDVEKDLYTPEISTKAREIVDTYKSCTLLMRQGKFMDTAFQLKKGISFLENMFRFGTYIQLMFYHDLYLCLLELQDYSGALDAVSKILDVLSDLSKGKSSENILKTIIYKSAKLKLQSLLFELESTDSNEKLKYLHIECSDLLMSAGKFFSKNSQLVKNLYENKSSLQILIEQGKRFNI